MSPIKIQSPTRVDLSGGTLDLWPLYNFIHGAKTVNVAIDIWTQVEIEETSDTGIWIQSPDVLLNEKYKDVDAILTSADPKLLLFQSLFRFWKEDLRKNKKNNFKLISSSQSPVGGGLGGSSSLTVSLMKAFADFLGRSWSRSHELVHICHNLEAEVLNTPTGTQDYYPAVSGGLNILDYGADGIKQNILEIESSPLKSHFLLVYTGKFHHSGMNNFEVFKAAVARETQTLKQLQELKEISEQTAQACLQQNWNEIPDLFRREYLARTRLAPAFTSPEIQKLDQISRQNGADAVKICGAGGGGCVLVWTSPEQREKVAQACQKAGFQPMNAQPVDPL